MRTRRCLLVVVLVVSMFGAACGSTPDDVVVTPTGAPGTTFAVTLGDRPFQLHLPTSYSAATKVPLVVLLHGYESSAGDQESYFKLTAESDRRGFVYALPDGTPDRGGKKFWNATAACCDFDDKGVDDSAYLHRLIETVTSAYAVDPARVYLVGHSNGGFMAYRMACEHASEITAIVSLAGAATNVASDCSPARPVSVLQIHGTDDPIIFFDGNPVRSYPSVATTLGMWRGFDGCADQPDTSAARLDLDSGLAGAETTVTTYATGCRDNTRVELWSIDKGSHIPALTASFAPSVVDFLYSRVSPS